MNKIYNIVWSHALQTWVVVSELTRAHKKKSKVKNLVVLALVSALTSTLSDVEAATIGGYTEGTIYSANGASRGMAIGQGSVANGDAVAYGVNAKARNRQGVSIGYGAISGVEATGKNDAGVSSESSVAIGAEAKAEFIGATAIGPAATAGANWSTAIGRNTKALGSNSIAIGDDAKTDEQYGISLGKNAKALGPQGISIGYDSKSSNNNSTAIGNTANATGENSSAIGASSTASGTYAVAMGLDSKAQGSQSLALGVDAKATNERSTATGTSSDASGSWATATGTAAVASGTASTAIGESTKASGSHTVAVGTHSEATGDNSFAAGKTAKAIGANSISIGKESKANSEQTIALGDHANATGSNSMALGGFNAVANGSNAAAIGSNSNASANDSIAFGNGSKATAVGGIALGTNSVASRAAITQNDVALKDDPKNDNQVYAPVRLVNDLKSLDFLKATVRGNLGALSVGSDSATRQITNVAAGSHDDDAVNVAQLKAVVSNIKHYDVKPGAGINVTPNDTQNPATTTWTISVDPNHIKSLSSWYLKADNDTTGRGENIQGDEEVTLEGSQGISTNRAGNKVTFKINKGTLTKNNDGSVTGTAGDVFTTTAETAAMFEANRIKYFSVNSTLAGNANNNGATATDAIAIGPNAVTDGARGITLGSGAKIERVAGANNDTSAGSNTSATNPATDSIAIGTNAYATASNSIVIGNGAQSLRADKSYQTGENTIAIGKNATANHTSGIAIGTNASAKFTYGVAIGHDAKSTGGALASTAVGGYADATGEASTALGTLAQSKGHSSSAVGREAVATGDGATSLGFQSNTSGQNGIAIGRKAQSILERSIALGNESKAQTTDAMALGTKSVAEGVRSIAIGRSTVASAEGAIAIGSASNGNGENPATAAGKQSVAIGINANVQVDNGIALGRNTSVTVGSGVAIGEASEASKTGNQQGWDASHDFATGDSRTNVYDDARGTGLAARGNLAGVSIGKDGKYTRQLNNLAAGTLDTDAVNVAQLKSVNLGFTGNQGKGDVRLHDQRVSIVGKDNSFITTTASNGKVEIDTKFGSITNNSTGTSTKGTNGLATTDQVVDAVNNAGWNIIENTNNARGVVKSGDTVNFADGTGTTVSISGNSGTRTVKINAKVAGIKAGKNTKIETTDGVHTIHAADQVESVAKAVAKDGDANLANIEMMDNTTDRAANARYGVSVSRNAVKDAAREAVKVEPNNTNVNNPITVTTTPNDSNHTTTYTLNFDGAKAAKEIPLTYKANGLNAQTVKLNDGLNFIDGDDTKATVEPNGKVKIDLSDAAKAKLGKTYSAKGAGHAEVTTSAVNNNTEFTVTVTDKGVLSVNEANGKVNNVTQDGLVTAEKVKDAINKSGFVVTSDVEQNKGLRDGAAATNTVVHPGDKVTFIAGENLKIKQENGQFTYSLNPTLTNLNSASFVKNNANTVTLDGDGLTIKNGNSDVKLTKEGLNNGNNKITNVAEGTKDTDAVNVKQLKDTVAAEKAVESVTKATLTGDENIAEVSVVSGEQDKANAKYGVSVSKAKVSDIAKENDRSIDAKAYSVDGDGTVTMTYVDGKGAPIADRKATITGIAKNDLSNITDEGKKVITGLSTVVEQGERVSVTSKTDPATGQKTYTISADKQVESVAKDTDVTDNIVEVKPLSGADNAAGTRYGVSVSKATVTEIAKEASAWKVAVNEESDNDAAKVSGGDVVRFKEGDNIKLSRSTKEITVSTSKDINVDTVTAGKKGADGKDGIVTVAGKDGASVVIKGEDGTIGLTGKDGKNATIGTKEAGVGIDGKDGTTRIVYTDSNNKQHDLATLEDGLKFTGNNTSTVNKNKLNSLVTIKGEGVTEEQSKTFTSAAGNINVVADGNGTLEVKLAKDINLGTDGSVTSGSTVMNSDGLTIGKGNNAVSLTANGLNNGNNKITHVAEGTKDTDAVNVSQLNKAITGAKDSDTRIKEGTYTVGNDGKVTMTYVNGKGETVTGKEAVIEGIAKNDLSNITDAGKTVINTEAKKAVKVIKGHNTTVTEGTDGDAKTYAVNVQGDLTKVTSITNEAGSGKVAFNPDGVVKVEGDKAISLDGKQGYITGLQNKDWDVSNPTVVSGRAATEDQLKTVSDVAKSKIGDNTISLGGDTNTVTSKQNLSKDGGIKFNVVGAKGADNKQYISTSATGDNVSVDLTQDTKNLINNAANKDLSNLSTDGKNVITNIAKENDRSIKQGTYNVDANGNVTMTYVDGNNKDITGTAVISGIAKQDLSNINSKGQNAITALGTKVVGGDNTVTVKEDKDATTGRMTYTITSNTVESVGLIAGDDNIATLKLEGTDKAAGTRYNVGVSKAKIQEIAKGASAWKISVDSANATSVNGGETVDFKSGDNIDITQDGRNLTIATKKDLKSNTVTVGEKGDKGVDGKVTANGKDGSSVVINGKDGSIGLSGNDGANGLTIKGDKGVVGVDGTDGNNGKDGMTRITYTDKNDVKHTVATLDDGMKYAGDDAQGENKEKVVKKKLNETVDIIGGADSTKLTDSNIGVNNVNGKLKVQLAKNVDLGPDGSVKTGNTTINTNGITITPSVADATKVVSLTANGLNNGDNKITNVAKGEADTDAVNVKQLKDTVAAEKAVESVIKAAAKDGDENIAEVSVVSGKQDEANAKYGVSVSKAKVTEIAKSAVKVISGQNTTVTEGTDGDAKTYAVNVQGDLTKVTSITNEAGSGKVAFNPDGVVKVEGDKAISLDGKQGYITGLQNKDWDVSNPTVVSGRAATEDQLKKVADTFNSNVKAAKTTVSVNNQNKDANKNLVLSETKNADGSTNYDVSLANKVTLGKDANRVVVDGEEGTITAGDGDTTVTVNGNKALIRVGNGDKRVSIDGKEGHVTNLQNRTWDVKNPVAVNGRAATEDQLKSVNDSLNTVLNNDIRLGGDTGETNKQKLNQSGGIKFDVVGGYGITTIAEGNKVTLRISDELKNKIENSNNGGGHTNVTTTSVLKDGKNTKVTGSGSSSNPYKVNVEGDLKGITSIEGSNNAKITLGGKDDNGQPNNNINVNGGKITNVKAGERPTDAVNVSQLNKVAQVVNNNARNIALLDNKINNVDRNLRAGIAGAMAAGGLYQATQPGKSMVSAGVGTYKGQNAIAVGYSRLSDNGKIGIKFSVNGNSQGEKGAAASMGYQW